MLRRTLFGAVNSASQKAAWQLTGSKIDQS
jgi:hypothetical protein